MSEKKRDILVIGCGDHLIEGAVHHDRTKHRPEVDVVHDLNDLPWPFEGEAFDLIVARAVLEHLDMDLVASVNECWRILRPGGQLYLKLPFWMAERSYDDPTHRWRFSPASCNLFDPRTTQGKQYGFYTPYKWRIVKGPRFNKAHTSLFWTLEKWCFAQGGAAGGQAPEAEAQAQAEEECKPKRQRKPRRQRRPQDPGDQAQVEAQAEEAAADLDELLGSEQAADVDMDRLERELEERAAEAEIEEEARA